jgi:hypothetical protein
MREIKFRAWNDIDKLMVDWQTLKASPEILGWLLTGKLKHFKPMQFTGVKTDCGTEVYQGDIFVDVYSDDELHVAKVDYNDSQSKYVMLNWHGEFIGDLEEWLCCPVAGNIYQNPELMEDKQ